MQARVSYLRAGKVAVITMDDGKVNALSPAMLGELGAALDRAEADGAAVVVLAGRAGLFSGGFDLKVMKAGGLEALRMVRSGFQLAARLLASPQPVVIACTGHAVAMGAFLVLSGDYRVGAAGSYMLRANEVAIGMTLPRAALAICRHRTTAAHLTRVTLLAEAYDPEQVVVAGLLDRVVDEGAVVSTAVTHAEALVELDPRAYRRTKQRLRQEVLRELRTGLAADMRELTFIGARRLVAGPMAKARQWGQGR